jgi:hypothetical protein
LQRCCELCRSADFSPGAVVKSGRTGEICHAVSMCTTSEWTDNPAILP